MALKIWKGGTTDKPKRWGTAANWSPAVVPVSGVDTVIFDDRANDDPANPGKKHSVEYVDDAGTDIATAFVTNQFIVKQSYTGNIGTDAKPILVNQASGANFDEITFEGAGNFYLKAAGASGNTKQITRLICKGTSSSTVKISSASNGATLDFFKLIELASGLLIVANATAIEELMIVDYANVVAGKDIKKNTTLTKLHVNNGCVVWASEFDTLDLHAGTFAWGDTDNAGSGALDCNLARIYRGATFTWQAKELATSVLKKFLVYPGGTLNAGIVTNRDGVKQIGAAANDISEVWNGGQVLLDNGTENISILADCYIKARGGTIQFPSTKNVRWS
jgi:hypothetical protein